MAVRRDEERWMLVRAMPLITSNNSRAGTLPVESVAGALLVQAVPAAPRADSGGEGG